MKSSVIFILFFIFAAEIARGQTDFAAKEFISSSKDTLRYRELLPENSRAGRKYPLVLFLHGAGEKGRDNAAQLRHGSMMFTNPVNREKYPAVVLFPQCPEGVSWPYDRTPEGRRWNEFPVEYPVSTPLKSVRELLDAYLAGGMVDKNRIYIIGLSMGGMGTFDMVCRYPGLFAAAVPICGGVAVERLPKARSVKFRIYHGDADQTVSVENSRKAYRALKACGAEAEYVEFPGCGHDSWNPAFNTPDFLSWLFGQKKKK
ncbi:MAG: dienelactone hydrolase family protein [Bacteroidales bacterium]|jgi:predicted peptidase|nr:dienelactone hydrolase family protein [Bacteroidales bacterium]